MYVCTYAICVDNGLPEHLSSQAAALEEEVKAEVAKHQGKLQEARPLAKTPLKGMMPQGLRI